MDESGVTAGLTGETEPGSSAAFALPFAALAATRLTAFGAVAIAVIGGGVALASRLGLATPLVALAAIVGGSAVVGLVLMAGRDLRRATPPGASPIVIWRWPALPGWLGDASRFGRFVRWWTGPTARVAEWRALAVLTGVAILLRVAALGSLPASLSVDEAEAMRTILTILNGRGPGIFEVDHRPAPVLGAYLMAPAVWLSGGGLIGPRVVAALAGAAAVPLLYLAARRWLSIGAALASAGLLAGGLWSLSLSRAGWEAALLLPVVALLLWLLPRAIESPRLGGYLAAGCLLVLAIYLVPAGRALPAAVLASLPLALAAYRRRWRRVLAGYTLMLAVALALWLPQIIVVSPDWRVLGLPAETFPVGRPEPDAGLIGRLERMARSFLLMDPTYNGVGANPRYLPPGWPFLDPVTAALYLVGLALAVWRWRLTWLWWPFLLAPLLLTQALAGPTPNGAWTLATLPVMMLFVGLALDRLVGERRWGRPTWAAGVAVGVAAIMAVNVVGYLGWQSSQAGRVARFPAIEARRVRCLARPPGRGDPRRSSDDISPGVAAAASPARRDSRPARRASRRLPAGGRAVAARDHAGRGRARARAGGGGGVPARRGARPGARPRRRALCRRGRRRTRLAHRAGRPTARPARRAGQGDGRLAEPVAMVVLPDGEAHVLDSEQGQVHVYGADGFFRRRYGRELRLLRPRGLAVGDDGFIYAADTGRNRLVRFEPDGRLVDVIPAIAAGSPLLDQPTAALSAGGVIYAVEPLRGQLTPLTAASEPPAPPWPLRATDTGRSARLALGPSGPCLGPRPREQHALTDDGTADH